MLRFWSSGLSIKVSYFICQRSEVLRGQLQRNQMAEDPFGTYDGTEETHTSSSKHRFRKQRLSSRRCTDGTHMKITAAGLNQGVCEQQETPQHSPYVCCRMRHFQCGTVHVQHSQLSSAGPPSAFTWLSLARSGDPPPTTSSLSPKLKIIRNVETHLSSDFRKSICVCVLLRIKSFIAEGSCGLHRLMW